MAPTACEPSEAVIEEIVYDSQEEQDHWPDSQSFDQEVSSAGLKPLTAHRPKIYLSQRKVRHPSSVGLTGSISRKNHLL